MTVIKISVVIPVLNEEDSVAELIHSLQGQTLMPTEVIVVDGGSRDKTLKILQVLKNETKQFQLIILEKNKANRSQARNLGIEQANSEIIAVTDAGCRAKPDWLEKIAKPFQDDPQTQVVAGFYDPNPQNWWQDVLADFTCTRNWQFDPKTFLPSSRSLAFTKTIWQQVGGYPENLSTCEDLVFAEKLKKAAKNWQVVKDAQVVWRQPKSVKELSEKVTNYAEGDLLADYDRHTKKIHAAKWRMIILLFFAMPLLYSHNLMIRSIGIGLFGLYILGVWGKHTRMLKYPLAWVTLPLVQVVVDVALVQALISHHLPKKYKS